MQQLSNIVEQVKAKQTGDRRADNERDNVESIMWTVNSFFGSSMGCLVVSGSVECYKHPPTPITPSASKNGANLAHDIGRFGHRLWPQ